MKKEEKKALVTKEVVDLLEMAKVLREDIFKLKLDKSLGKLNNTRSIFTKRKDLARILTVLTQKQSIKGGNVL